MAQRGKIKKREQNKHSTLSRVEEKKQIAPFTHKETVNIVLQNHWLCVLYIYYSCFNASYSVSWKFKNEEKKIQNMNKHVVWEREWGGSEWKTKHVSC